MFSIPSDLGVGTDVWKMLPQDEKTIYLKMKEIFHHETEFTSAHSRHHPTSFKDQLRKVFEFVDMKMTQRQLRGLLAGVITWGTYVCVNTRQLQKLTGRCKSSINNGFQQLGYSSLKSKSQTQTCLMTALPCLMKDQGLSRQWTVRYLGNDDRKNLPVPIISLNSGGLSSPSIDDAFDPSFDLAIEGIEVEAENRLKSDPNFIDLGAEKMTLNDVWW